MAIEMKSNFILPDECFRLEKNEYESEESMSVPSTPSTPISPGSDTYEVQVITQKDSEPLLAHLRKFFFKDEPLNVAVKLIEFDDSTCVELEDYSLKSINEGTSVMAITPSGKIVGVCLNGTIKMDCQDEDEEEVHSPNPKFEKIMKFLDFCGKQGTKSITKQFPDVSKVMFVKIISTDTAWRGKGIAKALMEKTRSIGRDQGYGLMRVDCTSYFSARAIARLGFQCVYELNYSDYKENGNAVFRTEHPHTTFSVYVQRILSSSSHL